MSPVGILRGVDVWSAYLCSVWREQWEGNWCPKTSLPNHYRRAATVTHGESWKPWNCPYFLCQHTTTLLFTLPCCSYREVEFIQKEDAERRRLEEAEKAHLAEIQGLQVRVNHSFSDSCSLSCISVLTANSGSLMLKLPERFSFFS